MTRICTLRCASASHPDIILPDGEEMIVGRSKFTQIKDEACSRQQVSLKANYGDCSVEIKQLGVNTSGLDGFSMQRNISYRVCHGMVLEILLNKYQHIIEFDPPPPGFVSNKRKLEENKTIKKIRRNSTSPEREMAVTTENTWENIDNGELYIFTSKGVISTPKIAAYDLDGTIIKTRSGNVHPTSTEDWQIAFPEVHSKLRGLYASGYKIVVLTNQAGIGKGRVKIQHFQHKVESIVSKLSVPVQCFVATGRGLYRKPMTGMWDVLVEEKNDNVRVDTSASFYCGDAAGRARGWAPGRKADHSLADRLLAENIGLTFLTPEEHFLGHAPPPALLPPAFTPARLPDAPFCDSLISSQQEVLVLVGFPASGKSTLARRLTECSQGRYVSVCRDELGAWSRCADVADKLLQDGKSVVVDSTNPDVESRARWTRLASARGLPCRAALLDVTLDHARHNNIFRHLHRTDHVHVTDLVLHAYKNKFEEPTKAEGFAEVVRVAFSPHFHSKQDKKLYYMHLLEK